MEFKSISELRAEYRDNPDYAIESVIPDMVAEMQSDSQYAGYTEEQLTLIAKAKLNEYRFDMQDLNNGKRLSLVGQYLDYSQLVLLK